MRLTIACTRTYFFIPQNIPKGPTTMVISLCTVDSSRETVLVECDFMHIQLKNPANGSKEPCAWNSITVSLDYLADWHSLSESSYQRYWSSYSKLRPPPEFISFLHWTCVSSKQPAYDIVTSAEFPNTSTPMHHWLGFSKTYKTYCHTGNILPDSQQCRKGTCLSLYPYSCCLLVQ